MKRSTFRAVFICSNLALVLLYLHNQSRIIKLRYTQQRFECDTIQLTKQKQELTHELHTMHDRIQVKAFAKDKLNLKSIKISQIKKLNNDTNN